MVDGRCFDNVGSAFKSVKLTVGSANKGHKIP